MIKVCAEFQAAAALRDGVVQELRRQLDESRRKAAELRIRVALGGAPATARSFADVVAGRPRHEGVPPASSGPMAVPGLHLSFNGPPIFQDRPGPSVQPQQVTFITPVGESRTPAKDVLSLLKNNINPGQAGIGDVTLRQTRLGVTVLAADRESLDNLKSAIETNTVTRVAFGVRIPDKRKPHVKLIGVDPEIPASRLLNEIKDRNPNLGLDLTNASVKTSFRERSGNVSFVVELEPQNFHKVIAK